MPLVEWWHWLLLLAGIVLVLVFSIAIYRRDVQSLPRPIAVLLLSLRLLVLAGLVVFFLGPEKRSEARIVKPSRLAVLVDTSLSMGLSDLGEDLPPRQRVETVVDLLQDSDVFRELNQQHELLIYRFGDQDRPELIMQADKQSPLEQMGVTPTKLEKRPINPTRSQYGNIGLLGLLLAVFLLSGSFWVKRRTPGQGAGLLAVGVMCLVFGVLLLAISDLLTNQIGLQFILGSSVENPETDKSNEAEESVIVPVDWSKIDWATELAPNGVATQLGEAVQTIVDQNRGSALAGMLLISDGQSNQGLPPARALASARDANIPVYTIGIGSNQPARNVRISELEAPGRVFPDDEFKIDVVLQASGLEGETVQVRLSSLLEDSEETAELVDERPIQLPPDGEPVSLSFDLQQKEQGKRRFLVEVDSPEGEMDASDNQQSTLVQVIERKNRVLLLAGGPTRDYQFLRNQLFRDENVELDVWLQLARPGADQESDQLLFRFPESMDELDQYDCIVAFDPDWRLLSVDQAKILERWISEKAGGLLVVAGPVFTPEWTRRPRGEPKIDLIRGLYPVSFYSQGSASLKLGRFGGEQPFPLEFSREGRSSRHLWLGGEDSVESISNWDEFDGVYGYYAVNEPKDGADILARFSDQSTAIEGELPIYLAAHYYGAGRVFFQASGEIWRLRDLDVEFFQTYYLNLIRWVSEGRLLRDSSRGMLLLDRNRCWVGDQMTVRAILRDASDQPLIQNEVQASLRRPDGVVETITMVNEQNAARPGTFTGQFVAPLEGVYDVSLLVPFSPDDQTLNASVRAAIPDLEKVKPERNDVVMQDIAESTGGRFFFDVTSEAEASWSLSDVPEGEERRQMRGELDGPSGLAQMIGVVDQESFLPGAPDVTFARKFARWLTFWLVLVLCTEWIVRRSHKLA